MTRFDLDELTRDNFDVSNFINEKVFCKESDYSNINALISQLQVLEEEAFESLENSTNYLRSNTENFKLSVVQLSKETESLTKHWESLQSEGTKFVTETTDSPIETLLKLDEERKRLEDLLKKAKETEKWTNLENEVLSLMKSPSSRQDLILCAEKLSDASKSLQGNSDDENFSTKEALLNKLMLRFEAFLKPSLEEQLSKNNFDGLKLYFEVYLKVEKLDKFNDSYFHSRQALISSLWTGVSSLRKFFEEAYVIINREFAWLQHWFASCASYVSVEDVSAFAHQKAVNTIKIMLGKSFSSLKPSVKDSIRKLDAKNWKEFIDYYVTIQVFILWLERLFQIDYLHQQSDSESNLWIDCLLEGFSDSKSQFHVLYSKYAIDCLSGLLAGHESTIDSFSTALEHEIYPELKNLISETYDHVQTITHGIGSKYYYRKAISLLLSQILKQYNSKLLLLYNQWASVKSIVTSVSRQSANSTESISDLEDESQMDEMWFNSSVRVKRFCVLLARIIEKTDSDYQSTLSKVFENTMAKNKEIKASLESKNYTNKEQMNELDDYENVKKNGTVTTILYSLKHSNISQTTVKEGESSILEMIRPEFKQFIVTSQYLLFSSFYKPIQVQLSGVVQMDQEWSLEEDSKRPSSAYSDIPTFSSTASECIQRAGELLMNIPSKLDLIIQSETSGVTSEGQEEGILSYGIEYLVKVSSVTNTSQLSNVVEGSVPLSAEEKGDVYANARLWMTVVSKSVLNYYIFSQVLKITPKSLGSWGVKQLQADMNYVMNVMNALGIVDEVPIIGKEIKSARVIRGILRIVTSDYKSSKDKLEKIWKGKGKEDKEEGEMHEMLKEDDQSKRVFVEMVGLIKNIRFDF